MMENMHGTLPLYSKIVRVWLVTRSMKKHQQQSQTYIAVPNRAANL